MDNFDKTILIVGIGTSPEVLPSTISALCLAEESIIPDEVVVITTSSGKELIEKKILATGRLHQEKKLLATKGFEVENKIKFGSSNSIKILGDGNSDFSDISSAYECDESAERIMEIFRQYTEIPETRLVISIAGGRKSLSALMFSCMTLLGRKQDRIFHVFISETNDSSVIPTLAELSYVRVRGWVDHHLNSGVPGYMKLVNELQGRMPEAINHELVEFDLLKGSLKINDKIIPINKARDFGFFFFICFCIKKEILVSTDWRRFKETEYEVLKRFPVELKKQNWYIKFTKWVDDKNTVYEEYRADAFKIRQIIKEHFSDKNHAKKIIPPMRKNRELYPKKYIKFKPLKMYNKIKIS